ncbi:MAG: dihydroneopterin aldolase [Acetobacter sp.]|nr:dihydroneopterin aldolase [Acetobacter sp.]
MSIFAPWADDPPLRCLFLRNMLLDAHIGVFPHEYGVTQRIRVSVCFGIDEVKESESCVDDLRSTVSYELVVQLVRRIVREKHVRLVETLANQIAKEVLCLDQRVRVVRVRVEKLDAFEEIEGVGVEIERRS